MEGDIKCDRCNQTIEPIEEREHLGQTLCEDCYIDVLTPLQTFDPWAVHSAKTYEKHAGKNQMLTPFQSEMLKILKENGPMEPTRLLTKPGTNPRFAIWGQILPNNRF